MFKKTIKNNEISYQKGLAPSIFHCGKRYVYLPCSISGAIVPEFIVFWGVLEETNSVQNAERLINIHHGQ
jgi:hypothetical protein